MPEAAPVTRATCLFRSCGMSSSSTVPGTRAEVAAIRIVLRRSAAEVDESAQPGLQCLGDVDAMGLGRELSRPPVRREIRATARALREVRLELGQDCGGELGIQVLDEL